jgi:hypothetical protein
MKSSAKCLRGCCTVRLPCPLVVVLSVNDSCLFARRHSVNYSVRITKISCADYDVPQKRCRIIIQVTNRHPVYVSMLESREAVWYRLVRAT